MESKQTIYSQKQLCLLRLGRAAIVNLSECFIWTTVILSVYFVIVVTEATHHVMTMKFNDIS